MGKPAADGFRFAAYGLRFTVYGLRCTVYGPPLLPMAGETPPARRAGGGSWTDLAFAASLILAERCRVL